MCRKFRIKKSKVEYIQMDFPFQSIPPKLEIAHFRQNRSKKSDKKI